MRESAFSKLGSQPWRRVLAAVSRSQASTCCCAAGCTDDVLEIRRASVSVYSKQFEHDTRPRDQDKTKFEHNTAYCIAVLPRENCSSVRPTIPLSICLSVCQTRGLWQSRRKFSPDFYTIRKIIHPRFMKKRTVGGGDPCYLKCWAKLTPLERKRRFSTDICS